MLDGVTFGGFNPVDINRIFEKTNIPVIVCMRSCPELEKIKLALDNLPEKEKRWAIINKAGKIYKTKTGSPIYFQLSGIDKEAALEIIRMSSGFRLSGHICYRYCRPFQQQGAYRPIS
jgi:hypothetical protein